MRSPTETLVKTIDCVRNSGETATWEFRWSVRATLPALD